MRVLAWPRKWGKTYALVRWVKQGNKTNSYPFWDRVIITFNLREADRLRKDHGLDYRQVFSAEEWQHARKGSKPVEVGIDNVDILLRSMYGDVEMITVTGVSEEP